MKGKEENPAMNTSEVQSGPFFASGKCVIVCLLPVRSLSIQVNNDGSLGEISVVLEWARVQERNRPSVSVFMCV